MSRDSEFEALVKTIAERVHAELGRQAAPAAAAPSNVTPIGRHHNSPHAHDATTRSVTSKTPCKAGKRDCIGCGWSVSRRPDDVRKVIDIGAARISAKADIDGDSVRADLAPYIDHTLLKARASRDELRKLCDEARTHRFASVCVNPSNVGYCARQLRGSGVPVVAVVGFPLGATTPAAKAFEAREAVREGATEIDMVINIGALKSGDYALVLEDIQKVVEASRPNKVKVIIETGELERDEKVIASTLSKIAGAAFVKTSTGFGPGGATAEDVMLMKRVVGDELEVKASGGMRTADDVDEMIQAGATRIGASASVAIVKGATRAKDGGSKRAAGGY